ncbi:unnamed protein product [Rotaria socialis]|uniref:Amine oxidase domain-containing protein n=1 Tax=Rotaria socialis TaxID=392032 RepID=A0A819VT62_9BILA|nr:unnamed protein product [Rotaria socialis]
MSTADQNLISQYHQVIIIGSGTAGLSAAYQLHKSGVKSVIILEGSKRIGGRILTEYLDENLSKPLEMGACWMHGLQGNPVYELAQRENFPAHTGTILNFDIGTCVDENGLYISSELHHEVDQFFDSLLQDTRDLFEFQQINNTQLSSSSIHKVFLEKFENFLNSNAGDNGTRSLKLKLLQRRFDQETGECGCQSMEQVSYSEFGSYQRPKGPDMEFPSGYSTLIRYLFSQIPQDWILFEQFVENILWDTDKHVKITCANGNIYECEQLICTIPLAVMKWSYKSLFTPALPAWKSEAIQKMDMGTVDKIYLFYDKIDFFTGSYSYVPVGASSCQHIRDLAEPLKVQDKSRVHFAGEHTHTRFYSTVTGAFITGQAQALEIIQELNTKNDTEMLVKANTDDFNKMQWKREEPP